MWGLKFRRKSAPLVTGLATGELLLFFLEATFDDVGAVDEAFAKGVETGILGRHCFQSGGGGDGRERQE